jgi:hypothetical protein
MVFPVSAVRSCDSPALPLYSIIIIRISFFKARGRALLKGGGSITGLYLRLYVILY